MKIASLIHTGVGRLAPPYITKRINHGNINALFTIDMSLRHILATGVALVGLTLLATSCESRVFADLSKCPTGLVVSLYSIDPCNEVDTLYLGSTKATHYFVFDDKGVLAAQLEEGPATHDKSKETTIDVAPGLYTVVSVVGATKDFYTLNGAEVGVTTKDALMLSLRQSNKKAVSLGLNELWWGESSAVTVPIPDKIGSYYAHVKVPMSELTRRVNVKVEIDSKMADTVKPEHYVVELTSSATHLRYAGTFLRKQEIVSLPTKMEYNDKAEASFTMLGIETGYDKILTIRNIKTGKVEWSGDVLHYILQEAPNLNLLCEKDYNIVFRVIPTNQNNHMVIIIYINDYKVHSFDYEGSDRY